MLVLPRRGHDGASSRQGVAAPDSARDAATAGRPAQSPASGGDLPWGFARDMPSLDELFAAAAGPAGRPARGGTSAGRGADPDAGQAQTSHVADDYGGGERFGEEAGGHHRSLYMRRLQDSRAFHCPDATECMAEALGAKEALQSLQVRVVYCAVLFRWSPCVCRHTRMVPSLRAQPYGNSVAGLSTTE